MQPQRVGVSMGGGMGSFAAYNFDYRLICASDSSLMQQDTILSLKSKFETYRTVDMLNYTHVLSRADDPEPD